MPVAKETDPNFKKILILPLHIKGAEKLYFSSIITEFTDSWTPRWSANNVYGRMDPVSFYGGTGRELTLGFRVISDDEEEAQENMRKIQKLVQYQYPVYKSRPGGLKLLMAPPYFQISFMNIVLGSGGKALQGYINGAVQINPGFQSKDQTQYFSSDLKQLHFSDVNILLRFQILHEDTIGHMHNGGFKPDDKYPYGGHSTPKNAPIAISSAELSGDVDASAAPADNVQYSGSPVDTNIAKQLNPRSVEARGRFDSLSRISTRNTPPDLELLKSTTDTG
jgi:hypothetical protein